MEQTPKRSKIWLYLIPVYVLVAVPIARWVLQVNSNDVKLSSDEATVFNAQEGVVPKTKAPIPEQPELNEGVLNADYKTQGTQLQAAKTTIGQEAQTRGTPSPARSAKQYQACGYTPGCLSKAVERNLGNPSAIAAFFNSKDVVSGFMSRRSVKAATTNPKALRAYLKKSGVAKDFANDPIVEKAINEPAIVKAVASSRLVTALAGTPAIQGCLKDTRELKKLLTSEPALSSLASNPNIMSALGQNPLTEKAAKTIADINRAK